LAQTLPNRELLLLKRLSEGDRAAFDQIFHTHWDLVYSAALVMVKSAEMAGDISQDVFLSLWENRHKAIVIENIQGFLYNNVKFLVHKRLRRMKVEDAYVQYLAYKSSVTATTPEQENSFAAKQLQTSLQEGVAKLPPQQQRAFKLSREQGLSHEQISKIIGVSKSTVKDYIVRSIAYLRQHLTQYSRLVIAFITVIFS
jgi:RNA polymerase sigma-70 factor (family 1)